MKFFIITLALATLAGSQAATLPDEPYPRLEELKQELQEYLRNISRTVNEKIDYINSLEIGQSIMDQLCDGYEEVKRRVRKLETELPPEVTQAYNQVVAVSLSVVEKGLNALHGLKRRVTPATNKLTESFYSLVMPYANSVLEKVEKYTEAMSRVVADKTEKLKNPELMEKLRRQLDELRSQLAPYSGKLQSQLEKFQASLEPYADRTQERFNLGVRRIKQALKAYLTPMLEALRKCAQGL
ncbi:hypothetical protein JRQ81_011492 [Phrynocephalus forsythii]|uniref:Apolipoprotein A-I n=1 Tax=Phrynocephalus forsythii TaxID=171643 RepID=A0A9Q0X5Z5_9SAUR|nr:hypothetical protein JRQ81_011492 [Phrynocephalus forsythii]